MDQKIIENFENFFNDQLLKDYKVKTRTKFYKELDELRKKDDEFSRKIERVEIDLWRSFLSEHNNDGNLINLVKIYDCLHGLKYATDSFRDLVNKD